MKKYDIIEVTWVDSHSDEGVWKDKREFEDWIIEGAQKAEVKTVGYFLQEDKDFIRICQSKDGGELLDSLFAIAKPCIKKIHVK